MKRFFYLLILLLSAHLSGFAQRDSVSLNAIIEKAVKTNDGHPIEKVYLHFDKPYYAVGDTIWFKAYLTLDIHQPSGLSRVLNVEMINARDSVVETQKIPINNAVGYGNITLNSTNYSQGNYRVRAYTTWMLNFKQNYAFEKVITIGSGLNKEINTNIQFSGDASDKAAKLNARVLYRNTDGTVLANKRVDWRVETNGDVMDKGKGTTDAQGYINIPVNGGKIESYKGTSLVTGIEVADKKTINKAFTLKNAFNGCDIGFFPEGGALLTDVPTVIGFKAIQSNGLGIDVKGTIVDSENKEVGTFSSQHLGMGKFTFVPKPNTGYHAVVEFANGTKGTFRLPRILANGVSLSLDNSNAHSLIVKVSATPTFFERNKNKTFYIVAKSGGFIAFAGQTVLNTQLYSATIPKSKFKTGVVAVTLMANTGEALSERLVFINRDDEALNLSLSTDKPAYGIKQKVQLKVAAKLNQQPVTAGSFSVSVIDATKVPYNEDAQTTILSHLLLTSDVTGYVEQPNYYFNKPDAKKADDLDVLMLTQGFRQFSMGEITSNKIPQVQVLPDQGISLSGNLRKLNGTPVFKGAVRLIIPDKNFSTETTTDADGNFVFKNVVFNDSSKVTISARNNVDSKNMKITMNGEPYPTIGKSLNAPDELMNIDSTLNNYVKNSEKQYQFNKVLKEVVIKAVVSRKVTHKDYSALTGLNPVADHEVDGERLKGCNNVINCLQSMLLGVTYDGGNFYITRSYNSGTRTPMQIYVKGLQVDVNYLNSLDPNKIASVETFFSDGLSGINRMSNTLGVISVNLKEEPKGTKVSMDDLKQMFPDPNIITFSPKGYAQIRQFYSPKYDVPKSLQQGDYRTTIYWNPAVTPDNLGNALLQFYNADGKGTYKAIIEGIDKDGNIGRGVYNYTVR
ncbi:carboxypeptidase-like regulatory domain-containing protein [Mucilaginibacter sp. KACC 22063]|uniref:carboxypeptidase-like regulatory domain-containing protein n=1 Tax=Mucilaginibacter sp. KACC 22063 TaxID=3025666 RepID=UPI0023657D38|nr:carboxypeptidase-like regulatory domain-containing protein [Mucilaginibacter sp. KACC 22063]WDF54855.1 carboxypeptidase-like regulatory domain-containing protein [Mucilaginibacter sp. KACC 22063]